VNNQGEIEDEEKAMNLSTSSDNTSQQVSLKLYSLSIYLFYVCIFSVHLFRVYIYCTCKSKYKVLMNLSRTSTDDTSLQKVRLVLLIVRIHFLCVL
jgi:hypothetical protein